MPQVANMSGTWSKHERLWVCEDYYYEIKLQLLPE